MPLPAGFMQMHLGAGKEGVLLGGTGLSEESCSREEIEYNEGEGIRPLTRN